MQHKKTGLPFAAKHNTELIEVLDDKDLPLMLMPHKNVLQQKLKHWRFAVIIKDTEGRIYLHKELKQNNKNQEAALQWTIPQGHCPAGNSLEGSALDRIEACCGIKLPALELSYLLPSCAETNWTKIGVFQSSELSPESYPELFSFQRGMFLDPDELSALLREAPDLMDKILIYIKRCKIPL